MPSRRLLAELVTRLNRPPEPTATVALAYILRTSTAAAEALVDDLRECVPTLPTSLQWIAEHVGEANGRPDLVGLSDEPERHTAVVIEAKFDARFQLDQIPTYLERLRPGSPGVLLLLAPDHRLPSLWSEAATQIAEAAQRSGRAPIPVPPPTTALRALHYQTLPSGHVLAATSWVRLLGILEDRARRSSEYGTVSDLEQLVSLVMSWDSETFLPFLDSDFDIRQARIWDQATRLLWKLREALPGAGLEVRGHANFGHEYLETVHETPAGLKQIRIIRGSHVWRQLGAGPLWVSVLSSKRMSLLAIQRALGSFDKDDGAGLILGTDRAHVPLRLRRNAGEDEVLDDLVQQIKAVAQALDSELKNALVVGTPMETDEPTGALADPPPLGHPTS